MGSLRIGLIGYGEVGRNFSEGPAVWSRARGLAFDDSALRWEPLVHAAAQARAGHFADLGPSPPWQTHADRLLAHRSSVANDDPFA